MNLTTPITQYNTQHIFKTTLDISLPDPFPRLTFAEAMNKYGSDKPDMRYDLFIQDLSQTGLRHSSLSSHFGRYFEELDEQVVSGSWAGVSMDPSSSSSSSSLFGLVVDELQNVSSNRQLIQLMEDAKKAAGAPVCYLLFEWKTELGFC